MFSDKGVAPDPDKIIALRDATPPCNKRELKSFLGMGNFSAKLNRNYAGRTVKLGEPTKESSKWSWNDKHARGFHDLNICLEKSCLLYYFEASLEKSCLLHYFEASLEKSCLLHYFEASLESQVVCGASPFGFMRNFDSNKNR